MIVLYLHRMRNHILRFQFLTHNMFSCIKALRNIASKIDHANFIRSIIRKRNKSILLLCNHICRKLLFYDQLHAIDFQYPILNINDSTQEANIFLQEMKSFFGRKNTSNVTNCVAVIGIREALLIGMTSLCNQYRDGGKTSLLHKLHLCEF